MLKIKNTRQIIIGFIIFAIIFFVYSDQIVGYISTLNPWLILLASVLLNPIYLIFIWSMFELYGIRGMIAGFLISTASDLISLPHVLTKSGTISTQSYNLITDTTFWNLIPSTLKTSITLPVVGQVSLGVFLVYIIISIGLVILALMLAHKKRFKEIFMRAAV